MNTIIHNNTATVFERCEVGMECEEGFFSTLRSVFAMLQVIKLAVVIVCNEST